MENSKRIFEGVVCFFMGRLSKTRKSYTAYIKRFGAKVAQSKEEATHIVVPFKVFKFTRHSKKLISSMILKLLRESREMLLWYVKIGSQIP
jgi:hypothetical protein